jgi:hypothetical protein
LLDVLAASSGQLRVTNKVGETYGRRIIETTVMPSAARLHSIPERRLG